MHLQRRSSVGHRRFFAASADQTSGSIVAAHDRDAPGRHLARDNRRVKALPKEAELRIGNACIEPKERATRRSASRRGKKPSA